MSSTTEDKRFKPFELNKVTALEKKRDFCDRPFYVHTVNNDGRQVTVQLNTIAYEALKNNTSVVLSNSGDVTLVHPTINCEDLEKATIGNNRI